MKHESVSINVSVLTPDELFDLVMEKVRVSAYCIYHKDASEVTPEDIRKEILGVLPANNYIKVEGGKEIFFRRWPAEYYRTKEQFRFAPTHDDMPCKAAYILIE